MERAGISMADEEPWQQLYRYWQSRHVEGRPPGRADIDPPIDVPRLIPNVMLIDVVDTRLRYRLVGSMVWEHYRLELTGTWIESRNPPEADWRDTLALVRDDQVPRLLSTQADRGKSHVAIAMPLIDATGRTNQIFAGTFFAQQFGRAFRVTGRLTVREVLGGG
jgi:hypothetical protein